jgi:hypothetical protein
MPRYANRVDENQKPIVDGLKAIGASVEHLAKLKEGAPDLLVGYGGLNYLLEIANPETRHGRAKREGSKDRRGNSGATVNRQREWYLSWRGRVDVVETLEQAVHVVTGRGKPILVAHF